MVCVGAVAEDDWTECVDCAGYFTAFFEAEFFCKFEDDPEDAILTSIAVELVYRVGVDAQTLKLGEKHLQNREFALNLVPLYLFVVLNEYDVMLTWQFSPCAIHHAHDSLDQLQNIRIGVIIVWQTLACNLHHDIGYELECGDACHWTDSGQEEFIFQTEVIHCANEWVKVEEFECAH